MTRKHMDFAPNRTASVSRSRSAVPRNGVVRGGAAPRNGVAVSRNGVAVSRSSTARGGVVSRSSAAVPRGSTVKGVSITMPGGGAVKNVAMVGNARGAGSMNGNAVRNTASPRSANASRNGGVRAEATNRSTAVPRNGAVRSGVVPRSSVPRNANTPKTAMARNGMPRSNTIVTTYEAGVVEINSIPMRQGSRGVKLGEIEDVKFVMTDVPKRALGDGTPAVNTALTEEPKPAKGRIKRKRAKTTKKAEATMQNKQAYEVPRTPFINQDKIKKRPLSKNVYHKQSTASPVVGRAGKSSEATNKEPVTIIAKPKKDSKAGLVIAIVLTIILGAVAGTVAFLLLPK